MIDLIPIHESETLETASKTVCGRDLHSFLETKTAFNDWIARRIQEYLFVEGEDFYSFLSKSSGGRPQTEYFLSIDMAKELSMVERSPKGREARRYFIQCEQRMKDVLSHLDSTQSPDPIFSDNPPPATEIYDPWSEEGMERINSKLALVREVRRTFGSVEARLLWTRVGLPEFPDKTINGLNDVKEEYARFATEVFVFTGCSSDSVNATDAYKAYRLWCSHHKTLPVSQARFFKGMAALSGTCFDKPDGGIATFEKVKSNHSYYAGVTIDTPFLSAEMELVSASR